MPFFARKYFLVAILFVLFDIQGLIYVSMGLYNSEVEVWVLLECLVLSRYYWFGAIHSVKKKRPRGKIITVFDVQFFIINILTYVTKNFKITMADRN